MYLATAGILFYCFRGMNFRRAFSHLGEIRSIIPENVHVMALTATATKTTRQFIIKKLNMYNPVIVSITPMRNNLIYFVGQKTDILQQFVPLCKKLSAEGASMDKVIIFCRRYDEVTALYHWFKRKLGERFTHPAGAPDLVDYRLLAMYTHCTHT